MKIPREVALAEKILDENAICNNCLGRQFPKFKPQLSNKERGLLLRFLVRTKIRGWNSEGYTWNELFGLLRKQPCDLCNGIFEKTDEIAYKLMEKTIDYEFETFLCGARIPFKIAEKEDVFRAKYKVRGESLKKEIVREVGLILNRLLKKETSFADPDIKITFEPYEDDLNVEIMSKPLFCVAEVKDQTSKDIIEKLRDFFLKEYRAESVKIKGPTLSNLSTVRGNQFLLIKVIRPKRRRIQCDQLKILERAGNIRLREVKKNFHKMDKNPAMNNTFRGKDF
ncbi:MAG: hypothetical protein ACUVQ8_05575 [Nitrososphaeria archaeon]